MTPSHGIVWDIDVNGNLVAYDASGNSLFARKAATLASSASGQFFWNGSGITTVPGPSSAIALGSIYPAFTLTANTGVTNALVRIEASVDGVNFTGIATLQLSAPGTATAPTAIPYAYYRANVIAIAGGSVSVSVGSTASSLSVPGSNVAVNPVLAGIAPPARYTLSQTSIPVGLPSSGSIGNNGALTLTTALATSYPNCWMYFPANAIFTGSTAGLYFVQMSSTTVGTIYNNQPNLSAINTIPTTPTPFVTTGPGAYTQVVSNQTVMSVVVPGGTMGPNGGLFMRCLWSLSQTATTKIFFWGFGSGNSAIYNLTSSQYTLGMDRSLHNRASQTSQVQFNNTNVSGGNYQELGPYGGGAAIVTSIDTTVNQPTFLQSELGANTDYVFLEWSLIEVVPG